MRWIATEKSEQNRAMADPWTVVHFAAGLAAGLVGAPRGWSIGTAIAYELMEQYAERQRWGQDFFDTSREESLTNVVLDVAVFALGHRLGEAWNDTRRPAWRRST